MSMSTHVVGFRPPDEEWKKMRAVWDACNRADITVPAAVLDFFNFTSPDDSGVEVELGKYKCITEYHPPESPRQGYEVDVRKLPPDIVMIRFYNSY